MRILSLPHLHFFKSKQFLDFVKHKRKIYQAIHFICTNVTTHARFYGPNLSSVTHPLKNSNISDSQLHEQVKSIASIVLGYQNLANFK